MPSVQCHHCGAAVRFDEPMPRDAECAACGNDLRCCINCRHYDVNYNNSCRETEAEPVVDKQRRNFCEFFSFSTAPFVKQANAREADARARLSNLFKSGGEAPGPTPAGAKERLDELLRETGTPEDRAREARKRLDQLFKRGEEKKKD
ncbi:MAG TPA: hypothetical protein VL123_02815 [Candidatus Udaeobacter sp.]|jgi:hypothetical protein|nr:hypothetical protein [Candidatus Udaeobacter sp.]